MKRRQTLWIACVAASALLGGCQSLPKGSRVRRETDRAQCEAIAKGLNLHEALVRMTPDGGCDVREWPS